MKLLLHAAAWLPSRSGHRGSQTRQRWCGSVALLAIIAVSVIGCSGTPPIHTSTLTAHASSTRDTALALHGGAKLVIPAGAMTNQATVSAEYTSLPTTSKQSTEVPIGMPVQFRVNPANAIHHPLELEWPLPSGASPAVAQFGAYLIGTYDTATQRWNAVDTAYDPSTHMLSAQITHFSTWSPVQPANDATDAVLACIREATLDGAATVSGEVTAEQFLRCLVREEVEAQGFDLVGKFLESHLPQSCISDLVVNGLLSLAGPEEVLLVATPLTILTTLAADPACSGSTDELPPPLVAAVSPASGPTRGGNAVTIIGTPLSLIHQITFGGVPAYFRFEFSGSPPLDSIVVTAPAHAAGTVDVQLSNGGGASTSSPVDQYTYTDDTPAGSTAPTLGTLSGTWQGQGTYNDGRSPFDMTLTIQNRGSLLAGVLRENVYDGTVAVLGAVTNASNGSYTVSFTDYAAVSGDQIALNCTYVGTVTNGHMAGTWYYAGDSSLDGTLTLDKAASPSGG